MGYSKSANIYNETQKESLEVAVLKLGKYPLNTGDEFDT